MSPELFIIVFKLVEYILTKKSGGELITNEYNRTKSLVDESGRKMVNILAADMTEKNGTSPPRQVKEMYAKGIVAIFPYLSDPYLKNGYVKQDFVLMFGEEFSGKLLERWPTTFKKKIIQHCRKLPYITELEEHLLAADPPEDGTELETGTNIQEHLDAITISTQPYLLAVGPRKNVMHQFFILPDKKAIPCRSTSSLGAFDELFKEIFKGEFSATEISSIIQIFSYL
ncbi:uncharacterized protein, partial [Clinocottus analis]|uniref:uncharacterized protein n=1 Tax=Clinocottus analis TaxID=304258 RepID=UPI0035C03936